ncbi:VOC family protein [Streptomyces sp. NPDC057137]|uniref:VOC family protein n=1 Tax=Streptomyces sp. NPDC057137 TaxID=3346030 RepID=UPI003632389E
MIWHVAFAVDDLDRAMREFGTALLLDWRPVKHYVGVTKDEFGTVHEIDTRLTFATAGSCAFELFEATPGTPNAPREGTAFHHLGYWAENLVDESERLRQCGWVCKGGPEKPDAESRAMFSAGPLGVFIEACNVTLPRAGLEKYYPTR